MERTLRPAVLGTFGIIGIFALTLVAFLATMRGSEVSLPTIATGGDASARISGGSPQVSSPTPTINLPLVTTSLRPVSQVAAVYSDSLAQGWVNASWDGSADFAQGSIVHTGDAAVMWTPSSAKGDWAAFSLGRAYSAGEFDVSPYANFRFYIRGDSAPEAAKKFGVSLKGSSGPMVNITPYIQGGTISPDQWRLVDIPLTVLEVDGGKVGRIIFQDRTGVIQPPTYFDNIEFQGAGPIAATPPSPTSISVNVNAGADEHEISPLIYGVGNSNGAEAYFKDMGVSLVRWGGNARTRHNWEINASNAGSDWEFRNINQADGSNEPGLASFNFVTRNKAIGAESLLTVPTLGWVARDGRNNTRSTNVPSEGGPPLTPGSDAIAGYNPATNRSATSIRSFATKGSAFAYPPETTDAAVYQDEWINYIKNTFGNADNGGVGLYAMDNEPDLWADDTHVDVHPVRPGYDELLSRFLEYAQAVKSVDPTAQVTGPVAWGWTSLWYSALDRGSDSFATHADRKAHGNVPFLQWFLQNVKERDAAAGQRTLDVLDVHYYPQGGVYSKATDTATQARRLRSTRSLWDPTYADESWMARSEGGPVVRLIPRLKEWIAANYPGTKLGITEWNWGADNHINGALAIADVLGIFGREDVYLANYWTKPADKSPGYWAWRMYRNYDGAHSRFGDISIKAQSSDVDKVSAYASVDSASGALKAMFVNKMPGAEANVTLSIGKYGADPRGEVYEYSQKDLSKIVRLPDIRVENGQAQFKLSPYSIALVVIEGATRED